LNVLFCIIGIDEEKSHAKKEPSRENDVIIDLPIRDEIVEAIKYLKDNKTVGSNSIAVDQVW
jgi:hypothetical protein